MSIRVFHIPPGALDRHKALISEVVASADSNDLSDILILTPTRQLAEDRMRMVHGLVKGCYIPPRIMTLWQFALDLCGRHDKRTYFPDDLLPNLISSLTGEGIGYSTLIGRFIRELRHRFPSEDAAGIREYLYTAFNEENISEEISRRAYYCIEIMDRLPASMSDTTDSVGVLLSAARNAGNYSLNTLLLDGFYEMTNAELSLVDSLLRHAMDTLVIVPISHKNDDLSYCYSTYLSDRFNIKPLLLENKDKSREIKYFQAKSIEDELEQIARHIKSRYISTRNRDLDDTWVVFPKLRPYKHILKRIFSRYGIPYTLPSGERLSDQPEYRDILCLLDSALAGFPRLTFSRFLLSPFFSRIPEQIRKSAPSIALSAGFTGGEFLWKRMYSRLGHSREINEIFKVLSPLYKRINTNNYSYFLNVLHEILEHLGYAPPDDALTNLEEVLGPLGLLDGLCGSITLKEFTEAVRGRLGLSGKQKSGRGVNIAELLDSRGLEPGTLYISGLKDGDLPMNPDMDLILPEAIRRRLGLMDARQYIDLQGRVFRRLFASAGDIVLTYPSMEGDKYFLPSQYISGGTPAQINVKGIFCEEERLTALGSHAGLVTGEARGLTSAASGTTLRVTDIDSYRRCPRRHLIEKVLRLVPTDVQDYEVEARELGTVMHRIMEVLIDGPVPGIVEFKGKAASVIEKILGESDMNSYFKTLVRDTFMDITEKIHSIEEELESNGHSPAEREMDVSGTIGNAALKGKIDRMDKHLDGTVSLIDYKTGSSTISGPRALRGEDLQLFIYAALLEPKGLSPTRVGVYSLADIRVKWVPNSRDLKNGNDISAFLRAAEGYAEETAAAISSGDYTARPQNDQICRTCHERPYCPYINGHEGTSDG